MGSTPYGNLPSQPGQGLVFVPYLNVVRGVRVDYPNTWMMQEQSSPMNFGVCFFSPQVKPEDAFLENLMITVQPVFPDTTQESFVQAWHAMAAQMQLQVLETAPAMLAGQSAYRVVFNTPPQPPTMQPARVLLFLFVLGVKGYSVVYTGQGSDFDLFLPTVQQMLATLQVR